jgi:hypothetical protein
MTYKLESQTWAYKSYFGIISTNKHMIECRCHFCKFRYYSTFFPFSLFKLDMCSEFCFTQEKYVYMLLQVLDRFQFRTLPNIHNLNMFHYVDKLNFRTLMDTPLLPPASFEDCYMDFDENHSDINDSDKYRLMEM